MKLKEHQLNLFFLVVGLILLIWGYQSIQPTKETIHTVHDLEVGMFVTILGSLMLGKWISDVFMSRMKKK